MSPKALFTAPIASLIGSCLLAAMVGCASQRVIPPKAAAQTSVADLEWRAVVQDGKTLYCSNVLPTGSHIAPGCLTGAALRQWLLVHWASSTNGFAVGSPGGGMVGQTSPYTSYTASGR